MRFTRARAAAPAASGGRGGSRRGAWACGRRVGLRRSRRRAVAGLDAAVGHDLAGRPAGAFAVGRAGADEAERRRAACPRRRTAARGSRATGTGRGSAGRPRRRGGSSRARRLARQLRRERRARFVLRRLDRACRPRARRARAARAARRRATRRSCSSPAVSSSPIVSSDCPSTAPASIRWARRMTEFPRRRLAAEDRPVDRRRAAVLRQARGVQVDAAEPRVVRPGARRSSARTR